MTSSEIPKYKPPFIIDNYEQPGKEENTSSVIEAKPEDFINAIKLKAAGKTKLPFDAKVEEAGSSAGGGHAGKLTFKVTIGAETRCFFAKPVNKPVNGKVEELNYQIIDKLEEPKIQERDRLVNEIKQNPDPEKIARVQVLDREIAGSKYITKQYGTFVKGNNTYFLMDDITRVSGLHKPLKVVADIKLAYQEVPGANPIYDPEEHKNYGMSKGQLDAWQMDLQNKSSGFLFVEGEGIIRFINYGYSDTKFKELLLNHSDEALRKLFKEVNDIILCVSSIPVAFIGASICILENPADHTLTVRLIDPAHMQVDPNLDAKTSKDLDNLRALQELKMMKGESVEIYKGDSKRYEAQRESNLMSLVALRSTINEVIRERSGF